MALTGMSYQEAITEHNMSLIPNSPETAAVVETTTVNHTLDRVKITRIILNLGNGPTPVKFRVFWDVGYDDSGTFRKANSNAYCFDQQADLAAIMDEVTLADEKISDSIERVTFKYLQQKGVVPAGSIEV